jgi:hypothetical protein
MSQSPRGPKNQKTLRKTNVSEPPRPKKQKTLRKTKQTNQKQKQPLKKHKQKQCFQTIRAGWFQNLVFFVFFVFFNGFFCF